MQTVTVIHRPHFSEQILCYRAEADSL